LAKGIDWTETMNFLAVAHGKGSTGIRYLGSPTIAQALKLHKQGLTQLTSLFPRGAL
jgi:hypothetical protein